jgi:type VI secretion system protein ImpC
MPRCPTRRRRTTDRGDAGVYGRIRQSGKGGEARQNLIDHHIELDFQISRQLDAVMHHPEFQKVESLWRGLKQLVDNTDYRQNVKPEILDVSKDDLRQDFEDAPELIQSGLYWHTYTAEYDTRAASRLAR